MENQTLLKKICPSTAQEWVKDEALLVDVREKNEVSQLAYDVPEIINMPLSVFEEHFTEIPKDKNVVVVCRGGGRSYRATGFLVNHGYDRDKVVNMQQGITGWVQKGFKTKGDITSVSGNTQNSGCCGTTIDQSAQSCCETSPNSDGCKCC